MSDDETATPERLVSEMEDSLVGRMEPAYAEGFRAGVEAAVKSFRSRPKGSDDDRR